MQKHTKAALQVAQKSTLYGNGTACSPSKSCKANALKPHLQDNQTAPCARGVTPMLQPMAPALQAAEVMLSLVLEMWALKGAG